MERLLFLKRFLASPGTVGSVTPSSIFLAKKMVKQDEVCNCQSIIELGAGTGIFTQYLLKCKAPNCKLYVFEKDTNMFTGLQKKFPGIELFPDATELENLLKCGQIGSADLIISGLPFTVLPKAVGKKILRGVFEVLKPGGKFVTFQYSFHMLKTLKNTFTSVDLEFVFLNIPPAVVYRCTKEK